MQAVYTLIRLYVAFWRGNPAGFLFLHALLAFVVAGIIFDTLNESDRRGN